MKRIFIESLGCPKNLVDTENVLGLLDSDYEYADSPDEADVLFVNTCAFIHDAEEESHEALKRFVELRKENGAKLVVFGCLAESETELLMDRYAPDAIVGTASFFEMPKVLARIEAGESGFVQKNHIDIDIPELPRVVTTPPHFAYLKISEGCDNRCTYCLIPSLRGKFRSRTIEDIVSEAAMLDVGEVILVAQDTSRYGIDLYGKPMLGELLKRLAEIESIRWIRMHYLYPDIVDNDLLDTIFSIPKVVKYFDIPVQHVSDRVLKRMGRHTSKADIVKLMKELQSRENPGDPVVIRTTFIVGFPGETQADFEELLDFVDEFRIDRLGVFEYSDMEKVPSYRLDGKIDADIISERRAEVMMRQQDRSGSFLERFVGEVLEVVIEEYVEDEVLFVCRSKFDAPEIDGEVYVPFPSEWSEYAPEEYIGGFIRVKIGHSTEYDLYGVFYEYCE